MKKHRKLLALLLCVAMTFSLFGCGQEPAATTAPTTVTEAPATEPPEAPPSFSELYDAAVTPLQNTQNLQLQITTEKTVVIGSETYNLTSEQALVYAGLGTDALQVSLSEDLEIDGYTDSFDEYYADGMLYVTIYDQYHFKGAITAEDYTAQFAPAVLLDKALYDVKVASAEGDNTCLSFSSPTAAESWAMPEYAELVSADGTALINADGTLTESVYNIHYTIGGADITMTVTVIPEIPASVSLEAPADTHTEVASIEALRLYETAVLYACSTGNASSTVTETIVSQAAGYMQTEQTTVNCYGTGAKHVSSIDYFINAYQNGESVSYSQEDIFRDGKYTVASDGGEPEAQSGVSAADMMTYCNDFLTQNMLALDYVQTLEATDLGGIVYLEIGCNDACGDALNSYINTTLFEDENFLNDMASAYATDSCTAYAAVDLNTGLPTAIGIAYSGHHTIDGADYTLSVQTDQKLHLASTTAYEAVTEEKLPEEEPEEKATPLFYHVTGEDGQEMWLLGTIHVGDERTAYLPQEIYDAFAASDALALEYDSAAFEEQMENDEKLQSQVSAAYYYSDGTAAADHISDKELYADAEKYLKASGNYSMNAPYLKVSLWSQSIENFYLQQGYSLTGEQGMESRLEKMAEEQGKEIRSVESGLFQIKMLTGWSDELQEQLLSDSLSYSAAEYWEGVEDLYEKWCAGDEAVMREELSTEVDTSEMTEEELAEYEAIKHLLEEYNKTMSYDRNEGMLDVAIEYLESGDVVFYAVGLAHLLDNTNGLVDTLREAGYTVELVEYAG